MKNVFELKNEALDEAYEYFDRNIRPLSKDEEGKIKHFALGLVDNDVDAFRHAYVSGVFTMELSVNEAEFYGYLQELLGGNGSSTNSSDLAKNMDLWNNNIGRRYGKRTGSRIELLQLIHKALKNGELIIDLRDARILEGNTSAVMNATKAVIVVKENKTGRDELYIDTKTGAVMERDTFVAALELGNYPGYYITTINDIKTPVSKPDNLLSNNLG